MGLGIQRGTNSTESLVGAPACLALWPLRPQPSARLQMSPRAPHIWLGSQEAAPLYPWTLRPKWGDYRKQNCRLHLMSYVVLLIFAQNNKT